MKLVAILCLTSSMAYIGWMFGISQKIEASDKLTNEAFKQGYIKGYLDGHAHSVKTEKPYYEDFPKMGIN